MNKLHSELQRLYLPRPSADAADAADATAAGLVGPGGWVRALVMELRRAPDWEVLARVWQGVQTELELPAPAIAVSGTDAMQLWFSLAEPVTPVQAHAFLQALRQRFLPDVDARRLQLLPAQPPLRHAALVPALQHSGNWSAFVARDLAPVFGDTPWLDIAPNEEGQASLLRGMAVTPRVAFESALQVLGVPGPAEGTEAKVVDEGPVPAALASALDVSAPAQPQALDAGGDPARFLRRVMDDDTVALALRIEAAKALLQHSSDRWNAGGRG
jgi:hypothetical protein